MGIADDAPGGTHRAPAGTSPTAVTAAERVAVWSLSILALALRLIPWNLAASGGEFRFFQPDALYHVRRVSLFLSSFPHVPGIDAYLSYPYGAECPWPPLYDMVQAALAALAGGLHPSRSVVCGVNSLLPPVLAALTIFPVHALGRRFGGRACGIVAAALFVALPVHLQVSLVGMGDHHAAEVFLLASSLAVFMGPVRRPAAWDGRREAFLSGLVVGAAVLVWQGSVVFAGVLVVAAFLVSVPVILGADPECLRAEASGAVDRVLIALAASTALVAAFRAVYPSETVQTVFDFGFFSWFQPALLLFGTLVVLPLKFLLGTGRGIPGRAFVFLLFPAVLAAPLILPAWRDNLGGALRFVTASDPWLSTILEFRPLSLSVFSKGWDFLPLYAPRIFILMMPVAAGVAVHGYIVALRRRGSLPDAAVLLACAATLGVLAAFQRRWANAYSPSIAIGGAWLAVRAFETARARIRAPAGRRIRDRIPILVAGLLPGAILSVPLVSLTDALLTQPRILTGYDQSPPFLWLRDHTPRTSGLTGGGGKPEYAVLAPWSYGHMVVTVAERPTIAGNFGTQLRGGGIEDLARLYFAGSEEAIADLFDRRGIRYLVLFDPLGEMPGMARVLGIDFPGADRAVGAGSSGAPGKPRAPRTFALPVVGMYHFDGASNPYGPAMTRFRLVHEAAVPDPLSGRAVMAKIFEYVRGARIVGRSRPGDEVTIACRLRTNLGRTLVHDSRVRADADGRFAAVFPYATRGEGGGTTAEAKASAWSQAGTARFDILEADVRLGRPVPVDFR